QHPLQAVQESDEGNLVRIGMAVEPLDPKLHGVDHPLAPLLTLGHLPDNSVEQPGQMVGEMRVVFHLVSKHSFPGLDVAENILPVERFKVRCYGHMSLRSKQREIA